MSETEPVVKYLEAHPWLARIFMAVLAMAGLCWAVQIGLLSVDDARKLLATILSMIGILVAFTLKGS